MMTPFISFMINEVFKNTIRDKMFLGSNGIFIASMPFAKEIALIGAIVATIATIVSKGIEARKQWIEMRIEEENLRTLKERNIIEESHLEQRLKESKD